MAGIDAGEQVVDWGHLDALFEEFLPTTKVKERNLGFEQIATIEVKITYLKERLEFAHLKNSKKQKAECQLADLETELAKLKAGHEEGAKVLRQKALTLAALPREMRDAIFEQIYVQDGVVAVSWSRHGRNLVFDMPKDTALYMSSLHVGESLAREAAEVFYRHNTFTFVRSSTSYLEYWDHGSTCWEQAHFDDWFTTDHYGSGSAPRDFVRRLEIHMDRLSHYYVSAMVSDWQVTAPDKVCNHIAFEDLCKNVDHGTWHDHRRLLHSLLQYDTLQHVKFAVVDLHVRFDSMVRLLNPVVRKLRNAGVKVTFIQRPAYEGAHQIELSSIFDTPSDGDYAEFYEMTQRKSVFTDAPDRDIFDSWKVIDAGRHAVGVLGDDMVNTYMPVNGKFGFMRVWLFEHYEMHKFLAREYDMYKVVDEMVQEFRSVSSEERELRRRIYPKMLAYCQ